MTAESRHAIAEAQRNGAGVYVSPISAWELATLVARRRIQLALEPEIWFGRMLALAGVRLAPMPRGVLIASAFLPGAPPRDPADRIIAATGRAYGLAIVPRDGELVPCSQTGNISAILC